MIVNNNYKSVEIDIVTYQKELRCSCFCNDMNTGITEKAYRKSNQNRFICSICLNKKQSLEENRSIECCKRISKSCPICQRTCETDDNQVTTENCHKIIGCNERLKKQPWDIKDINAKNMYIQTSQSDVTKGLTLLNEVLTVFQSKKQSDSKNDYRNKTLIFKDASIVTEMKNIPKLTVSKTFIYSIEENDHSENQNGKYVIINCQPDTGKLSQFSIDLIKHKSSSIPQMKLEELKNSLKEKTKSKDAIEEVNRMFATVRKNELRESLDDSNRPMIRNGPRVLPVVKTKMYVSDIKGQGMQSCRHCQTSYHMSSGDSFMKNDCCRKQNVCENCYRSCCHYKHHYANTETICERCCKET